MITEQDLRIDIHRGEGAAVRVTHLPTGLSGTGLDREGSSRVARDLALLELVPKLREAGVQFPPSPPKGDSSLGTFEALLNHLNGSRGTHTENVTDLEPSLPEG